MTRSIFDPTGGETEHSGSRNLGPDAADISHLPPRYRGEEENGFDKDDLSASLSPEGGAEQTNAAQPGDLDASLGENANPDSPPTA